MKLPIVTGTLDLYITEINRFSLLTAEDEFKLAVRLKKYNDMDAAETLIVSNLRFVVKIAHEYRNYGFKLADLIQEGNIGLIHAVKKFDPYRGYRLISYAVWWIRAYIQNYLIKSWSIVKIGTTQAQRKLFFKLSQAKKQLESLSKKNPEFAEIAESLGVKGSEVEEMDMRMGSRDVSLHEFIGDDAGATHIDFLAYEGDNQEVALIMLSEIGWQIDVADDGSKAVDLAAANDYQLILMDMHMPVMDGLEATEKIRQLPQGKHIPIIAMTANAFTADKERCLDAGMNDFVTKPVAPAILYEKILKLLSAPALMNSC